MEFLLDPGIWVSLLTLIILEIVLGIDNLLFIAILSARLPARQGKTAEEIANELGCSKSTIDKSAGWKNRKNDNFM